MKRETVVCARTTGREEEVLFCVDEPLMVPTLAVICDPKLEDVLDAVESAVDCAAAPEEVVLEASRIEVMSESWGDMLVVCLCLV